MKCLYCEKETFNPKFCSQSCSAKFNNSKYPKRRIIRKCVKSNCENFAKDYKTTLCLKHWQENQKDYFLNLTLKDIGNLYTKDDNSFKNRSWRAKAHKRLRDLARHWFKDMTEIPCASCGYDKHVELCHIKSIADFPEYSLVREINCKENLIQFCPNCHWEFDNGLFELPEGDLNPPYTL